jgi:hypothetical protein
MADPEYVSQLSMEAVAFLISLPKRKQQKVLDLADTIASNPFQISDYPVLDSSGRQLECILIEEFYSHFG